MALINWSDELSVNISIIDQQHKKLVEIINEFHDAMVSQQSKEPMGKLFNSLIEYTATHFTTEEDLFKEHSYPHTDEHKREHRELAARVAEMKDRFDSGRILLSLEVMNFLRDWLTTHIQGDDKKYAKYLEENSIKVST